MEGDDFLLLFSVAEEATLSSVWINAAYGNARTLNTGPSERVIGEANDFVHAFHMDGVYGINQSDVSRDVDDAQLRG